jgi:hypothetical protein
MWLYPLPALAALFGWLYLFATSDKPTILGALAAVAAGVIAFLLWTRSTARWPFAPSAE